MNYRRILNGIFCYTALTAIPAFSQVQNYAGSPVTGIMVKTAVVNLTQLSGGSALRASSLGQIAAPTASKHDIEFGPTSVLSADTLQSRGLGRLGRSFSLSSFSSAATIPSIPITTASGLLGFNGLTHKEQLDTFGGNQFSVEPPNQAIAVANGYILEGVNSAVRVYSITGTPLISPLAANQVFAVAPAIIRNTGTFGVRGTDMRIYYDHTISRWFIIQRAQDFSTAGAPLASSKIYVAVSQTSDPTQTYTIYTINTTNPGGACPCIADYPQIGSDQFGFYIATNEYVAPSGSTFVDARVLAISKSSLTANTNIPTVVEFRMSNATGYEFSLQPATTAPGSSSFLASGGLEYFVSTISLSAGSNLAIWAMTNTGSLNSATPVLSMQRILLPVQFYAIPNVAALQKNGTLTLGTNTSEYFPPFTAARPIDGGDSRVQSVTYSGGKLYVAWATQVTDEAGHPLSGAAYAVVTPTYRSAALAARLDRQGYLQVANNNLLRPYWAVNAAGKGAITFTLVGPGYFPTAAFITADTTTTGSSVQIVAAGVEPEDGFTGYDEGIARWGDYNGAVAIADGSIWMVSQYIPGLPRSLYANWGTYVFRYVP